jgi:hypothetical protein
VKWLIQYQQILATLKKKGLEKPLTMPASQFSTVVRERFPLLTISFLAYTKFFEALMYQPLSLVEKEQRLSEIDKYHKQLKKQLKSVEKSV